MKKNFDKKYIYWGITAFLVLAAAILFAYIVFFGVHFKVSFKRIISILMPVIYGFVLAYITTPIVNFYESSFFIPLYKKLKKYNDDHELSIKEKKYIRVLGIIGSCITICIIVYALFKLLIPQLIVSIQNIISNLPTYVNNLTLLIIGIIDDNPELEKQFYQLYNTYYHEITNIFSNNIMPSIQEMVKTITTGLMGSVISILKACWNFIIGIIISIYLINSKERFVGQIKKFIFAFFDVNYANNCIKAAGYIHKTFIGFVSGKIVDSAIIGMLCFIGTSIIRTPYPIVISVIVGVTNIIPFFGPYLGAIPCALLILMVSPIQCLYFLIFIFVLQQIDGNIIGPKILGDSTGLTSFWVIFSITLFGGLFGIIGMILGVPLFAVIYASIRFFANKKLKEKNLPIESDVYASLSAIDNNEFIHKPRKRYYRNRNHSNNYNKNNSADINKNRSNNNS